MAYLSDSSVIYSGRREFYCGGQFLGVSVVVVVVVLFFVCLFVLTETWLLSLHQPLL